MSHEILGVTLLQEGQLQIWLYWKILKYRSIVGQICPWMRGLTGYCNNKFNQGVLILLGLTRKQTAVIKVILWCRVSNRFSCNRLSSSLFSLLRAEIHEFTLSTWLQFTASIVNNLYSWIILWFKQPLALSRAMVACHGNNDQRWQGKINSCFKVQSMVVSFK